MNDRRFLLFGIPLLAALELVPRGGYGQPPGWRWLIDYAVALVFTITLWLGNRQLWQWLRRRWPRPADAARRLWWLAAAGVAYTVASSLALAVLLAALQGYHLRPAAELREISLNLVSTFIVLLLYESRHLFEQWETNLRRADQLAQAATQAQLDALRRQVDPHFLFNSLNTLSALIDPANEAAQHYVDGLADVYRYVLLARERPTVPLTDELTLVRTYLALQQVRFGQGLRVVWEVAAAHPAARVAPLSVQELVENALKHNETSRAHPLTVTVAADGGTVRVTNTYQPRPAGLAPGTGTGLANLRQRYALLGASQPVAVAQAGGTFAVTLPLLVAGF